MAPHLTRREMYELVWSAPIADIASRLGVTEGMLRDRCALHRVPLPAAAYWRDKAAGKRVKQTIFVRTSDPRLELIVLDASRPPDSALNEQLERQREIDASRRNQPSRLLRSSPLRHEIQWEAVKHAHAVIADVAKELRRARPAKDGIIDLHTKGALGASIGATSVERVIFILDTLVRELQSRGITCVFEGKEATAIRGEDRIEFKLTEKIALQPHVPTVDELKAEERRLRSGGSDLSWLWQKAYPQFDRIPTHELCLSITSWGGSGFRKNWKDGARASLEAQLATIPSVFDAWINDRKQARLERERQSRLWKRAEENRQLAKARDRREESRLALMDEIVELKARANQLSSWLDWAVPSEDPDVCRMIEWARQRLHEVEQALNPEGFGDLLRMRTLFPEIDSLAPLPEDPDEPNRVN